MKRLFIISAMLIVFVACKKDDAPTPSIKDYVEAIETYAAKNPDGFIYSIENNKPITEGYAIDLEGNQAESSLILNSVVEEAVKNGRTVVGWLDLDDQMIDRTKSILGAKPTAKLSLIDIRDIECQNKGSYDSKTWYKNLYNSFTFQMIEYVPNTNEVHAFFKPFDASTPTDPKARFVKIPISTTAE